MTTITYRDGVMASDSQASMGDTIIGETQKIFKIRGHLVGFSGTARLVSIARQWMEENLPELNPWPNFLEHEPDGGSIRCWLVTPKGKIFRYEDKAACWGAEAPYVAGGSGCDFALGAMAMGATAVQGIKAAIAHDVYSGGPIKTIRLTKKPVRR